MKSSNDDILRLIQSSDLKPKDMSRHGSHVRVSVNNEYGEVYRVVITSEEDLKDLRYLCHKLA